LRQSVALLKAAGVADFSQVALLKRLRSAGTWLAWIAAGLVEKLRDRPRPNGAMRLRVVDGTTIRAPASQGTDWRLHYTLDLSTLQCDWQEVTDSTGAERMERVPVQKGDVLLADRYYFTASGVDHVADADAHVVIRLRWNHPRLLDRKGRACRALDLAESVKTGQTGEGLRAPPYPGELGKRIYENVSQQAWRMWLQHQTMLINEYRLTPIEPKARKFLEEEMEKYFFGAGSDKPKEFVQPQK